MLSVFISKSSLQLFDMGCLLHLYHIDATTQGLSLFTGLDWISFLFWANQFVFRYFQIFDTYVDSTLFDLMINSMIVVVKPDPSLVF